MVRDEFVKWGYPKIPVEDYGPCSIDGLNKPCNRERRATQHPSHYANS